MTFIGITQRVDIHPDYAERRDALDQNWYQFCSKCSLVPILIPNNIALCQHLISTIPLSGFILTGGNSPVSYGGNAPERDCVENYIIKYAEQSNIPIIGVCRGMQMIQLYYGTSLSSVTGHVNEIKDITFQGVERQINSYHELASTTCDPPLALLASSNDGVVKAIQHQHFLISAIMWHPERNHPFHQQDITYFRDRLSK